MDDGPAMVSRQGYNILETVPLDNKSECLGIIFALLLKSPCNKPCLEFSWGSVCIVFDPEYPFCRNGLAIRWQRNTIPSYVLVNGGLLKVRGRPEISVQCVPMGLGPMYAEEGESYSQLRTRLKDVNAIKFPFEF